MTEKDYLEIFYKYDNEWLFLNENDKNLIKNDKNFVKNDKNFVKNDKNKKFNNKNYIGLIKFLLIFLKENYYYNNNFLSKKLIKIIIIKEDLKTLNLEKNFLKKINLEQKDYYDFFFFNKILHNLFKFLNFFGLNNKFLKKFIKFLDIKFIIIFQFLNIFEFSFLIYFLKCNLICYEFLRKLQNNLYNFFNKLKKLYKLFCNFLKNVFLKLCIFLENKFVSKIRIEFKLNYDYFIEIPKALRVHKFYKKGYIFFLQSLLQFMHMIIYKIKDSDSFQFVSLIERDFERHSIIKYTFLSEEFYFDSFCVFYKPLKKDRFSFFKPIQKNCPSTIFLNRFKKTKSNFKYIRLQTFLSYYNSPVYLKAINKILNEHFKKMFGSPDVISYLPREFFRLEIEKDFKKLIYQINERKGKSFIKNKKGLMEILPFYKVAFIESKF